VTIGPVIDNGFYYDFSYKRPFTPEDLAAIEKKMTELARKDEKVTREVWNRDEAVALFESMGEKYKAEIIASIPRSGNRPVSRRRFVDLCRGPHVPSTGKLKVFKLMKVAGAYWRGDSNNEMLQRIYGTAWAKKEDQDAYLHMLEEAEKRDHRAWASAGPVPPAGRGAGHGVLAPEGLERVAGRRAVHARRLVRPAIRKCARRR
jgi:threonyl-tRNA synthetase